MVRNNYVGGLVSFNVEDYERIKKIFGLSFITGELSDYMTISEETRSLWINRSMDFHVLKNEFIEILIINEINFAVSRYNKDGTGCFLYGHYTKASGFREGSIDARHDVISGIIEIVSQIRKDVSDSTKK